MDNPSATGSPVLPIDPPEEEPAGVVEEREDEPLYRLRERVGLRLGILGGAFDPIHVAHLVVAEEALAQLQLDYVIFMPAGNHPQKPQNVAPDGFRYLLVSVATAANPRFLVSRYELEREAVGYTVDTLAYLGRTLPDAQVFFIVGADAVLDLTTWKDPQRVTELCTLVAATRPGYDLAKLEEALAPLGPAVSALGPAACVRPMEIPPLAVSSTMIRERLAAGLSVRYLVPEAVAQLIAKSGYYGGAGAGGDTEATALR